MILLVEKPMRRLTEKSLACKNRDLNKTIAHEDR